MQQAEHHPGRQRDERDEQRVRSVDARDQIDARRVLEGRLGGEHRDTRHVPDHLGRQVRRERARETLG